MGACVMMKGEGTKGCRGARSESKTRASRETMSRETS